MRFFSALFACLLASALYGQNTVGLLSYNPSRSFDGYNLIYPHNQSTVYLLNNCGEIVHTWTDAANLRPGNTAYLMPNGNLVKTKRPAAVTNDPIWAGGGGATVEVRDWDNNLAWAYTLNDSLDRLHHDIAVTPDNTILMIVWERKTAAEAIQAGRNPALLTDQVLWPDYILEVDPAASANPVIWEWHAWDHLVQDFDPTKDNYGDVAAHPELIDLNWDTSDGDADWMHSNAIDYDPVNDQILLSVPTFNEVWIIDHTTTTAEAAGHTGGFSGRGGDLMYRWGNPAAYRAGDSSDIRLFYQHATRWIDDFIDPIDPFYGKIQAYNNQVSVSYSTANVFTPNFDMYTWEYPMTGNVWGPAQFDKTITHPVDPAKMQSDGLSSIQYLPNGNFLIQVGRPGYAFELTPQNEIVWEYKTPLQNGAPVSQGAIVNPGANQTFRMDRYPVNYAAFAGRDLSPKGWIELNPDTNLCNLLIPTTEVYENYGLTMYPNPAGDMVTLEWSAGVYADIAVYDALGRTVFSAPRVSGGRRYVDTGAWPPGVYFVRVNDGGVRPLVVGR
ncbi:MAG: aryl-sulfate sulfotransferase [Saprospiraceae bacterium]|nr:aryl-sulfate sulfotransferase [Saprospiraceae bacterium]